jgi:hypothetical protein
MRSVVAGLKIWRNATKSTMLLVNIWKQCGGSRVLLQDCVGVADNDSASFLFSCIGKAIWQSLLLSGVVQNCFLDYVH